MEDERYNAEGESSDEEDNTFLIISEDPIPFRAFFIGSPLFQHKASAHTAWGLLAINPFKFHTHTAPRYSEVPFDEQSFNGLHSFQTSNVCTPFFPPHKFNPYYAPLPFNHAYDTLYQSVLYLCTIELQSTLLQNIHEECDLNSEPGDTDKFLCFPPSIYHVQLPIYPYRFTAQKGIPPTGSGIYTTSVLKPMLSSTQSTPLLHPNKRGMPLTGYFYPGHQW